MTTETKYFYANGLEVGVSAWDFNLRFSRRVISDAKVEDMGSDDGAVVDALVVTMSPMHAKAMIAPMKMLVDAYEAKAGTIPLPEDALKRWKVVFPEKG